ncbi:MAG TPA: hypothetical protein VNG51_19390 [Ktedonobacteraceae bacterium]|nr:hypothetical protein [Ktedonobacteraceae bacterium]
MSVISKFLGNIVQPNNTATFSQLQLANGADNGAVIKSVKVTLTSAQILALNTTPITLIAAQGANTYIEVLAATAKLDFGTVAYTGANAANITYTNGAGAAATGTLSSSFLDSSSSAAAKVVPAAVTPVVNSPVVISVGTANPAAGDSTITLDLFYRVVTLA